MPKKSQKSITEFQSRVYKLTSLIPKGKVSTYGALSKILKSSPRAVGQVIPGNPFSLILILITQRH